MIGPDQDLDDFPPWIWPYIRVADLAKSQIFGKLRGRSDAVAEKLPRLANEAHLGMIMQAVALKSIASHMGGDVGKSFAAAADRSISEVIDDYCGTPPGRHPPIPVPHIHELAARLAVLAASFSNERLGRELGQVAQHVSERAQKLSG